LGKFLKNQAKKRQKSHFAGMKSGFPLLKPKTRPQAEKYAFETQKPDFYGDTFYFTQLATARLHFHLNNADDMIRYILQTNTCSRAENNRMINLKTNRYLLLALIAAGLLAYCNSFAGPCKFNLNLQRPK